MPAYRTGTGHSEVVVTGVMLLVVQWLLLLDIYGIKPQCFV